MEAIYSSLAARALEKHKSLPNNSNPHHRQRTVIALAGPPGSGKSTIASAVVRLLNTDLKPPSSALIVPMDGFHLPRSTLNTLPNRAEAYARRGAAWTFDAQGVLDLVTALHASKSYNHNSPASVILAPSFDHELKDPTQDAIAITSDAEIVILEGNWLLLDEEPWRRISDLVDETWFVDVDPDLARERIAKRHLRSGIERDWESAARRAESNDLRNGELVRTKRVEPSVVVMSVQVGVGA